MRAVVNRLLKRAGLAFAATLTTAFMMGGSHAWAACPSIPNYPEYLPCPDTPEATVRLEHEDRTERLSRLSRGRVGFTIEEDIITSEEHGLADFDVDIPILRVTADQDVFFDSGSHKVRPEAYVLLDIVADSLKREPPDVSVFVAGHTDSDGSDADNMALGFRRAAAVSEALLRRGVYQAGIYRLSFGEHMPIASNSDWRGKARNRRVEFLFGARSEAIVPYLERQKITFCGAGPGESSCEKTALTFSPERISLSMESEKRVVEIEEEVKELEIKRPSLSPLNYMRERQKIEFKRERIPIVIEDERIPIVFTR